jgi:hypothetical protein
VELVKVDAIESAPFRHEEGNEGEKIGVKRGIGAFYGAKLLKRQEEGTELAPKWFRAGIKWFWVGLGFSRAV